MPRCLRLDNFRGQEDDKENTNNNLKLTKQTKNYEEKITKNLHAGSCAAG